MEHILNVRAIVKKMKVKPKSQRIYHFFWGTTDLLDIEQMKDMKKIIEKEHTQLMSFIDKAILDKKKKKAA